MRTSWGVREADFTSGPLKRVASSFDITPGQQIVNWPGLVFLDAIRPATVDPGPDFLEQSSSQSFAVERMKGRSISI